MSEFDHIRKKNYKIKRSGTMNKYSLNGNLILTPYRKAKELTTKQAATGFAIAAQKIGVEPLELLVDTVVNLGDNTQRTIKKGSKIYFKEAVLHVQKWPREIMESDFFPGGFVIGSINDAVFVEENDGE